MTKNNQQMAISDKLIRMSPKKILKIAGIFALGITLASCKGQLSEKPPIHPNLNMDMQPRKEAQEVNNFFADGRSMRQPVEGTVPRGKAKTDSAYYFGLNAAGEYIEEMPVKMTKSFLHRGKERYDIFCAPCHGKTGAGNGIVMEGGYGYVPAPSYHIERLVNAPDGELYSAIANGVRTMPSYATQVPVEDRWAIVAYIRALQESQRIPESELQQYDVDIAALKSEFQEKQARQDSIEAASQPEEAPEATADQGKQVATANACNTCHSIDGSSGIGPTWQGLFGSEGEVVTQEGETITITKNEDYIRESIVAPEAKKPVDFQDGVMASYSYLSESEIESLILYIKSLSDN